jgi:hypothetical protein
MAARSLVQALEGLEFPCDRSRLIEYARRQELSPRSLDALQALPDRQFRDRTELFSALPSKSDMSRRRATVVRMEPRQQPEQRQEEQRPRQEKSGDFTEAAVPPPVAAPLQNDPDAPADQHLDMAMQWWRWNAEMWPEWVRMTQRLWFPWMR